MAGMLEMSEKNEIRSLHEYLFVYPNILLPVTLDTSTQRNLTISVLQESISHMSSQCTCKCVCAYLPRAHASIDLQSYLPGSYLQAYKYKTGSRGGLE